VTVAERLRSAVESNELSFEEAVVCFTVSAGVTPMLASDSTWESMLRRADAAMYEAKRSGRNRVVLAAQGDMRRGGEQRPASMSLSVQVPLPLSVQVPLPPSRVEEQSAGSEAPSW
jgi:hypothetical protein